MGEAVLTLLLVVSLLPTGPAPALQVDETEGEGPSIHGRVELIPAEGVTLSWGRRQYAGRLQVRGASDGLVLVERTSPEDYLLGIQEVPFTWDEEALKAQAVAARTYLGWTLQRGRAGAGATYGFDICATAACQVYGGLDQVRSSDGRRWEEAVRATEHQVLLYEGSPAQALYGSTTGGRTRAVEDVFTGSTPRPYLEAVPSPGEDSPYVDWAWMLSGRRLADILGEAGAVAGVLEDVWVETTDDGTGPWMVVVDGSEGRRRHTSWEFRGILNRYGPELYPDLLPAQRPDGRQYPQVVLSPSFTVERAWQFPETFRSGFIEVDLEYTVAGKGWGHLVGMSQYGAKAMADAGAAYGDILAHYYGGLRPVTDPDALPAEVEVGLSWGESGLSISADGPVAVVADGETLVEEALGTWTFTNRAGEVEVTPPQGFGLPPRIRDLPAVIGSPAGRSVVVRGTVSVAAELRLVVFRGGTVITETAWTLWEPGGFGLVWGAAGEAGPVAPGAYRVLVEARSPDGEGDRFATVVIDG